MASCSTGSRLLLQRARNTSLCTQPGGRRSKRSNQSTRWSHGASSRYSGSQLLSQEHSSLLSCRPSNKTVSGSIATISGMAHSSSVSSIGTTGSMSLAPTSVAGSASDTTNGLDASEIFGAALMALAASGFVGNEIMKEWRGGQLDLDNSKFGEDGGSSNGKGGLDDLRLQSTNENRIMCETKPLKVSPALIMATSAMAAAAQQSYAQATTSSSLPTKTDARTTSANKFISYDVSARALKGERISMEDEYVITDGGRFVAVFDGHGGSGVSRYLRHTLYQRMQFFTGEDEEDADDSRDVEQSGLRGVFPFALSPRLAPSLDDRVAALRSAFRSVGREVLNEDRFHYQGSTAVACVMHEGDDGKRTLITANIGDSRAVLSRNGRVVNLTRDHKPNNDNEKARILSLGEEVIWDGHVHRVCNLSLSRAIGDRFAKPAISGEVEIKRVPIHEGDEFVVLASDGLWDVMSSEDVVNFVHEKLSDSSFRRADGTIATDAWKRRHMTRFLAKEALNLGSVDNVCIIIVWVNDGEREG